MRFWCHFVHKYFVFALYYHFKHKCLYSSFHETKTLSLELFVSFASTSLHVLVHFGTNYPGISLRFKILRLKMSALSISSIIIEGQMKTRSPIKSALIRKWSRWQFLRFFAISSPKTASNQKVMFSKVVEGAILHKLLKFGNISSNIREVVKSKLATVDFD